MSSGKMKIEDKVMTIGSNVGNDNQTAIVRLSSKISVPQIVKNVKAIFTDSGKCISR